MTNKKIIFIHGKNTKPSPAEHRDLLLRSLRAGFTASRFAQDMRIFDEADFALCAWSNLLYPEYADAQPLTLAVDRLQTPPNKTRQNIPLSKRITVGIRRLLYLLVDLHQPIHIHQ